MLAAILTYAHHPLLTTHQVAILMLAAILTYVFSDDESLAPGQSAGEPVPADAVGE